MFLRVNGLYGWVQANDRRSLMLFAGFLAALNVAAILVLYIPLLTFDPEHAPGVDWGGYATRYVPLISLAAIGYFALHLFRHVRSVQRLVGFDFVDDAEEPRLCRLVETLAIGMGLPAPYVGVIDARALNAFACGVSRRNAVVVVTRGLLDELDDDELAAVLAHELAHIANGDIRLLAAANACLRLVGWLIRPRLKKGDRLRELVAFPFIMLVMPPLFFFVLIISLCAQSALRGSRLIRLLIASSREFIADARAVEATQNPSALVSALRRLDGRSRLADLPPGQDAMMIDGACEGGFATHPTIARRIEAIVAATGAMALIAPPRRDTRPIAATMSATASPIHASVFGTSTASQGRGQSALRRIGSDDDRNWLGLTPTMTVGALLGIAVFLGVHRHDLARPAALVEALDPRPAGALFAVAGRGTLCNVAAMGTMTVGLARPAQCDDDAMLAFTAAQGKVFVPVGEMLTSMNQAGPNLHMHADGHFSSVPPPAVEAANVQSKRCFRTRGYTPGDAGLHKIDEPRRHDGAFDIRRWLEHTETLATAAAATERDASDKPLKAYIEARKFNYETIDHFFGEPGLALARRAFASPAHRQVIERLRDRLNEMRWVATLSPVEVAEVTLLATSPDDFISCVARRRVGARH